MKDNKLIAINTTQKMMSQTRFNCRIDTRENNNTIELLLYIQELTTVIQDYVEDAENEKDLLMDKIRKLQA